MSETSTFTGEEAERIARELGVAAPGFDLDQFRRGLDVELEHGSRDPGTDVTHDDALLTGKIALAHLREFADYYDRLEAMEQEAEGYWQSRAAGEPAGGSPGGAADVNQAGGEDKRPHVLQEGSQTTMSEPRIWDAPFDPEVWGMIKGAVQGAARSQQAVRRMLPTVGPFGPGLKHVPGTDEPIGDREEVRVAVSRALPLVEISASFALPNRDLAAFKAGRMEPDLTPAVRAALRVAAEEDRALLYGIDILNLSGLTNLEGTQSVSLAEWGAIGSAADNVIEALTALDVGGFHGPYLLALSPDRYNLLFRRYPQGDSTELEHVTQMAVGGVIKAPSLAEGGILLAPSPHYAAIVLGQDLHVSYVGPTADMRQEFAVSESLALRVLAPGAICVIS